MVTYKLFQNEPESKAEKHFQWKYALKVLKYSKISSKQDLKYDSNSINPDKL
mgnify:CR=1 FL=1